MLRPYEMSSVIVTGPKSLQEKAIEELHKLKVLHIVDHSKNELADIGKPLEIANKLSELLVKARALITLLNINTKEEASFEIKRGLLEIEVTIKKLNEEANTNFEELKKIEDLISRNAKDPLAQELEILGNTNIPLENFTNYKSIAYFTGYLKGKQAVLELEIELLKSTKNFSLFDNIIKQKNFITLFIDKKYEDQASKALQKHGFSAVKFSNISGLKGFASNHLKKIEEEVSRLEKKKQEIKRNIEFIRAQYKGFLITAEKLLSHELEKAEAPLKFASTSSSFLIKGWVPNEELIKTIDRLNKSTHNKIFVHFAPANKNDTVPVKLKNPKPVNSFEVLMNLYTIPSYKEIDPTFFMFLTFPILFGFMLGDFGYGLTTLIIFMILKKSIPKAKDFFNVLILSSLSSMVFGMVFGEFFGHEELFGYEIPHLLSRSHSLMPLLYLSVGVGLSHIMIGLAVGFINEMNSHGFMHAVYAKGGWYVLLIGGLVITADIIKIIKTQSVVISGINTTYGILVGIGIILLSAVMLFKGEGIKGLIEIPGIFGNILSYARLMAIGVSSVQLDIVVNEQAGQFFHAGPFMAFFGVLILIIGHLINIVLGLMGSFLHSLRLHYVEFFTKFFEGGAIKYSPFGLKS